MKSENCLREQRGLKLSIVSMVQSLKNSGCTTDIMNLWFGLFNCSLWKPVKVSPPNDKIFIVSEISIEKLKFKCIKNLNINLITLNIIEEKLGSILEHSDTGNYYLNITGVA